LLPKRGEWAIRVSLSVVSSERHRDGGSNAMDRGLLFKNEITTIPRCAPLINPFIKKHFHQGMPMRSLQRVPGHVA
jgi:hypothetical protein